MKNTEHFWGLDNAFRVAVYKGVWVRDSRGVIIHHKAGRPFIEETLTYCDFPSGHWIRIRTNNVIERLNREIRRRTRVAGCFPDGSSALMLVCARLHHVAGTQWGNKKYMNMKHLEAMDRLPCRLTSFARAAKWIRTIILTLPKRLPVECGEAFIRMMVYCCLKRSAKALASSSRLIWPSFSAFQVSSQSTIRTTPLR